jgi:hypothetical protein
LAFSFASVGIFLIYYAAKPFKLIAILAAVLLLAKAPTCRLLLVAGLLLLGLQHLESLPSA